jgi:hypothetical protein
MNVLAQQAGASEVSRSIGKFSCSYQLYVQEQQARAAATQPRAVASTERWESHAWWSGASSSSHGWTEPHMGWNAWREANPGAPRRSKLADELREEEEQRRWEAQSACGFALLCVFARLMFVPYMRCVFLIALQHRHPFPSIAVGAPVVGAH